MNFTKLQASGNDFVLVDARHLEQDWAKLAVDMCDRHFGIGADGLLLVLPSGVADFRVRVFNPDGSEAEMCGNGLTCLAKYVVERGLLSDCQELTLETEAGVRKAKLYLVEGAVNRIQLSMGSPRFKPSEIPVSVGVDITPILGYPISLENRELFLTFVSMGNPHAVCFLSEPVSDFPLAEVGPKMEHHLIFPQGVNFEVANVLSRQRIAARVWERGVGETLACGSGACAITVAARLHGYIDDEVDIVLPGGTLVVAWDGEGVVLLNGSAKLVFSGEWVERE